MQFLYPFVLFGLVALAIPVIIHLFDFKKPRRIFFTNVRFLAELKKETRKRSKIKHLLVLLMRLMAFAALIFAFAMPVMRTDDTQLLLTGNPLVVVYIDNSYSMQSNGVGGVLFEEAVRRAGEIASHYSPSDEFYLITNEFSGIYSRVVNRSDFMEMITTVRYSPISRTGAEVLDRMADVKRRHPMKDMVAYYISDFQSSTVNMTGVTDAYDFQTYLVPLKRSSLSNLSIDSVWLEVPVVRPGQIMTLSARVGNSGSSAEDDVPVTMSLNGREVGFGTVDVPADGNAVVQLSGRIDQEGIYHGVVALDDYPVVFDDRFYFGFEVRDQRNIGGFYGVAAEPNLSRLFDHDTLFRFSNRPVTQIDFATIHQYDIIFCQGITELSSGLAEALTSYVGDGGTLVVIPPSPPHDPTAMNTLLASLGVLSYGQADTNTVRLESIDFSHPLYRGVYLDPPSNLAMPVAYTHYPMQSPGGAGETVIMRLLNGRPMLVGTQSGRGLVYQFATSWDQKMTNLLFNAELFVPPIYNMALFSGIVPPLYYTAGKDRSVSVAWPEEIGQSVFRIRGKQGEQEFIPGYRSEPYGALLFFEDQIERAGNYQVYFNNQEVAPLAFNYSSLESDLNYDDERALRSWIRDQGMEKVQVITPGGKSMTERLADLSHGTRLWRWFIMAALLFLLAESLILRFWKETPKNNQK